MLFREVLTANTANFTDLSKADNCRIGDRGEREEEELVPSPTRLVCTPLWVCGVEAPCSGSGGKGPGGLVTLSPEDEAKCYINSVVLTP